MHIPKDQPTTKETSMIDVDIPQGVTHWVYILYQDNQCIYIGQTSDLIRRIGEHKKGFGKREPAKDFNRFHAFPAMSLEDALHKESMEIEKLKPLLNKTIGRKRKPVVLCQQCGDVIRLRSNRAFCSQKCSIAARCESNKRFSTAEEIEVCKQYTDGASTRKLAEIYNINRSCVSRILKRQGVNIRHKRWPKRNNDNNKRTS